MHYISGAYVGEGFAMYPLNDRRVLRMVIQRQCAKNAMIEMEFQGLKCLKLAPSDEDYTCEILNASFFVKDGLIYWCDNGDVKEDDIHNYKGTVICSKKVRWRNASELIGKRDFYKSANE